MSATRKKERERKPDDVFYEASRVAGELREVVADQLHDLVLEREEMAGLAEIVRAVERIGQVNRQIVEARGRQQQAREMGLPVGPHARKESEGRRLLRQAVMSLGMTCGAVAVAMDFDDRRDELERTQATP